MRRVLLSILMFAGFSMILSGCTVSHSRYYSIIWIIPYSQVALVFQGKIKYTGVSQKESLDGCHSYLNATFISSVRSSLNKIYQGIGNKEFDAYFNLHTFGCIQNNNIPLNSSGQYYSHYYIVMEDPYMIIRGYDTKEDCDTRHTYAKCFIIYNGIKMSDYSAVEIMINTYNYLAYYKYYLTWK